MDLQWVVCWACCWWSEYLFNCHQIRVVWWTCIELRFGLVRCCKMSRVKFDSMHRKRQGMPPSRGRRRPTSATVIHAILLWCALHQWCYMEHVDSMASLCVDVHDDDGWIVLLLGCAGKCPYSFHCNVAYELTWHQTFDWLRFVCAAWKLSTSYICFKDDSCILLVLFIASMMLHGS